MDVGDGGGRALGRGVVDTAGDVANGVGDALECVPSRVGLGIEGPDDALLKFGDGAPTAARSALPMNI